MDILDIKKQMKEYKKVMKLFIRNTAGELSAI